MSSNDCDYNFIKETEPWIDGEEVDWIGSKSGEYAMSWDEFKEKFKDVEYYSGYGAQHIATDLVIVFADGSWLEREEYDGSERWRKKSVPTRKDNAKSFDVVGGNEYYWEDLEGMNEHEEHEEDTKESI